MYYAITHLTLYNYDNPITDSVMEIRMQPRSDKYQRCIRFQLNVSPEAQAITHRDYLGNLVQTFDIPAKHTKLAIKAEAVVEAKPRPELPASLSESAWDAIDHMQQDRDYFDMLLHGQYAHPTPLLHQFAQEIDWRRRGDPLSLLRELNTIIYERFEYRPHVTKVDSTVDVALQARRGVCQDFAHIMITLVREIGIPCRYVGGYLFHRTHDDRSDEDASHAWLEAWLPQLGWVGFDPTNNVIVSDRHIQVSISSDYAGASPSRGVFKGTAETKLEVRVKVSQLEELPIEDAIIAPDIVMPHYEYYQDDQQQQQQQ